MLSFQVGRGSGSLEEDRPLEDRLEVHGLLDGLEEVLCWLDGLEVGRLVEEVLACLEVRLEAFHLEVHLVAFLLEEVQLFAFQLEVHLLPVVRLVLLFPALTPLISSSPWPLL